MSPKILYVEDDVHAYKLVQRLLERRGYDVTRASNGSEAIDIFQASQDISLILMDLHLPGMDGIEAIERIREYDPAIPILAITACVIAKYKKECLAAGCDEYITKPFRIDPLVKMISEYCKPKELRKVGE